MVGGGIMLTACQCTAPSHRAACARKGSGESSRCQQGLPAPRDAGWPTRHRAATIDRHIVIFVCPNLTKPNLTCATRRTHTALTCPAVVVAEFQHPADWLADQTVAYRAAQRAEASRGLPPSERMLLSSGALAQQRARAARSVAEPTVAFGPPGTSGEENISVIAAPIAPGFTLQSLGGVQVKGDRHHTAAHT
jgi:hypothetical protein